MLMIIINRRVLEKFRILIHIFCKIKFELKANILTHNLY